MTLHLLGTLRWEPAGEAPRPLPAVLPVAILLVLARHGQWMSRAKVAAIFWPDTAGDASLLNLRVNVHKARRLLEELSIEVPVESDRRGLRWAPPTDVGETSRARGPVAVGFELPAFERFAAWLRDWRESCAGPSLRAVDDDDPDDGDAAWSEAPLSARFYGRRVELARLRSSNAPATLVSGEPGVGKSRLVAAAFDPTIWLRCREGMRQASFCAVAELFAAHPSWLQDLGAYRLDVARLLPDVAPDEPLPPLDALTARVRLFEALARTIERHVDLLAVDDLQWADAATVEWLVMLAHRGRLRWVATARGEEIPASTHTAIEALEARGALVVLPLQGLDRTAMNSLLHDRRPDLAGSAGVPRPHAWLDALWSYTGGNAFCAIEVMDALTADDRPQRLSSLPLPDRVASMVRRRREGLDADGRAVVDACALAVGAPSVAQLAAMTGLSPAATLAALDASQAQGLTKDTACRHDVVREAIRTAILPWRGGGGAARAAPPRAGSGAAARRRAPARRGGGGGAGAGPWMLRVAQRLKQRGEREAAVAALSEIRDATSDAALALRADIMLAQEHLFDDLPAGRLALESTLVRARSLPPDVARQTIEAHALSGLVDNAVFSGDLARASGLVQALRERLPGLDKDVLVEAHQVLIEATMRFGDAEAARVSLQGLRDARAAPAVVLSFEAQIHWFTGEVREARSVFEGLLARHPDYCQGLTIENDLAVMCHALGDLGTAEAMARRSLRSWAGVAHTEALSSLVLGSTLTSSGRYGEAREAFERARELGRQQGSALFVSEALARRSRLHWCEGDPDAAIADAMAARAAAGQVDEPLRGSGLALAEMLAWVDVHRAPALEALARLEALAARSRHPVVRARLWRGRGAAAEARGDGPMALDAARRQVAVAREAGLAEWLCEALGRVARLATAAEADAACAEAQVLAHSQGFGWLVVQLDGEIPRPRRRA